MSIWRTVKRAAIKPKLHLSQCANCPPDANCPLANHYTRYGNCANVDHDCREFKAKDWSEVDAGIRRRLRGTTFDSQHERRALTDVIRAMARGESDVVDIHFKVPFPLGLHGSMSTYVADAVATLKPGGLYIQRIYEPKGAKTPIYLLKRRIVHLMYPEVEFVEVVQ